MNRVSLSAASAAGAAHSRPRWIVVSALGICQILAWGSSYYLPAVLAVPIGRATGWPATWILGGLSIGLLISGLISPYVGRTIDRLGGRPVLASSAVLLAIGSLGLALAPDVPAYIAAWIVIGFGMGAGLYDPAFSALGRLYGEDARPLITGTTLFAGFSSTICWPLSAVLAARFGWRGACLTYAAILIAVVLPLYLFAIPREPRREAQLLPLTAGRNAATASEARPLFWLLAVSLTLASVIMTLISVELIVLLQARGLPLAMAVMLGTFVGPSQVGARIIEFVAGRHLHPIWTMLVSTLLVAVGLALLLFGPVIIGVGLVLYGAGGGIRSIVRGTLPLALFGREGYATLMGRLAFPSLLAQAAAPAIGGVLLSGIGATRTILVVTAVAIINVFTTLAMVPLVIGHQAEGRPAEEPTS